MINKICPKCGSSNVKIDGQRPSFGGYMASYLIEGMWMRSHICLNCGYMENWLSKKQLDKALYMNRLHKED